MGLPAFLEPTAGWLPLQVPFVAVCFLQMMGFTVFPFMMSASGGISFLLPIVVMSVVFVAPFMYIQLRLGGITQRNVVAMLGKYFPISKGIGIALMLQLGIYTVYHPVKVGAVLWYAFVAASATNGSSYPWAECDNPWNTAECVKLGQRDNAGYSHMMYGNYTLSVEEYYRNAVLRLPSSPGGLGDVVSSQAGMLFLTWVFVCGLVCGGPRIFGWLAMILGPLLIMGVTVLLGLGYGYFNTEDAKRGYMLVPVNHTLGMYYIWQRALTQMIYATCTVSSCVLPSFGKFAGKGKIMSAVTWIPILFGVITLSTLVTVMYASYVGLTARALGAFEGDFVESGMDFVSTTITSICSALQIHPSMAFVLFGTVFLSGVLGQGLCVLVVVDCILEFLYDDYLKKIRSSAFQWRLLLTGVYCFLAMLLGLPMTTSGGMSLILVIEQFLWKLDFIYYAMLATALLIVFVQRKQLVVTERAVVCIVVAVTSTLSVLMVLWSRMIYFAYVHHHFDYVVPDELALGWLVAVGPLLVGLTAGVIHAFLTAPGSAEQKFIYVFAGDQKDPDNMTSPTGTYPMMAPPPGTEPEKE